MPQGFFSTVGLTTSAKRAVPLLPRCGECKLNLNCQSPKMPVDGQGKRGVLVVAEAPGREEDLHNRPLIGAAGQLLRRCLDKIGVDLNRDCWLTNSLICRPEGNRTPTDNEIGHCRPNVVNAVTQLQPEMILLLGATAVKSVIGWLWKEDVSGVGRWVGQRIPSQKLNTWVCPAWHPSYLERLSKTRDYPVLEKLFVEHLEAAFALKGRPWAVVPDHAAQVKVLYNSNEAVQFIKQMQQNNRPVAFDIETDRLKPDHPEATIWSASLSDGETTISYPWHDKNVKATLKLLRSSVPKLGWNAKFETRWLSLVCGVRINNFVFDGMLGTHVLDNRSETKSLKFQAFVRLGQDAYDAEIKPYLRGVKSGGNEPNRIREAPLAKLLLYGGLDALLEWLIDVAQAKELGIALAG